MVGYYTYFFNEFNAFRINNPRFYLNSSLLDTKRGPHRNGARLTIACLKPINLNYKNILLLIPLYSTKIYKQPQLRNCLHTDLNYCCY